MDNPEDLVGRLVAFRRRAGRTQEEVAKAMEVEQSKISRLERTAAADLELDLAIAYLEAVNSEEAKHYRGYLVADWSALGRRPSFDNPDLEALAKANGLLRDLDSVCSDAQLLTETGRLRLLRDSLIRAAEYLADMEHPIAAVGDIAVGKTTLLCALTNLRRPSGGFPRDAVLEVSAGGTTLCPVEIRLGSACGIHVEPEMPETIMALVRDFCETLLQDEERPGHERIRLPQEIERVIRHMTHLPRDPTDKAEQIARSHLQQCGGDRDRAVSDMTFELLRTINPVARDRQEVTYPGELSREEEFAWLQKKFSQINNGQEGSFSLPRRIVVYVRAGLVSDSPLFSTSPYRLALIDTKGVDGVALRQDLKAYLDDPRAVTLLCSGFGSAPDVSLQQLLDTMLQMGSTAFSRRAVLSVLARTGDLEAVKDEETREWLESATDIYDRKTRQVRARLRQRGLQDIAVHCVNAGELDLVKGLVSIVIQCICSMRKARADAIDELDTAIRAEIHGLRRDHEQIIQQHVANRIMAYIAAPSADITSSSMVKESTTVKDLLLDTIVSNAHASSVWAATRRNGSWYRLDAYLLLGLGAGISSVQRYQPRVDELKRLVSELETDEEFAVQRPFLGELRKSIEGWWQSFVAQAQVSGQETFRPVLGTDSVWSESSKLWGMPRPLPFKRMVESKLRNWFEPEEGSGTREELYSSLRLRIDQAWNREFLQPLRNVFDK
jgi:transcriptional regulator with XRE-family HTH domain